MTGIAAQPARPRTPLRDNLEWLAIVVLLVLVGRQMVVEAFRIRHGSMAPTVMDVHKEVRCPNCGWVFSVGTERGARQGLVQCPNCGYLWDGAGTYTADNRRLIVRGGRNFGWLWNDVRSASGAPLSRTDAANRVDRDASRIFVNKFIYHLRKPRRWEVVVFRYPLHAIRCKVCGWQGETESPEDAVCPECGSRDFDVKAKDFIKRVVGLPGEAISIRDGDVYVNGHIARKPPSVQRQMWQHVYDSMFKPRQEVWPTWKLSEGWTRDPPGGALLVDARGSSAPLLATFARRIVDYYPYDGPTWEASHYAIGSTGRYAVGDCRVRAKARVLASDGGGRLLLGVQDAGRRFLFGISIGRQPVATLEEDGMVVSEKKLTRAIGRDSVWLGLENYDDRVVCTLGGRPVFRFDYAGRPGGRHGLWLGADGAKVLWERVIVDRDIYYISLGGAEGKGEPYRLGSDEYFMLGDNSPASSDSRRWSHPGIPAHNLIGRAIFVFWPVYQMKWLTGGGGR